MGSPGKDASVDTNDNPKSDLVEFCQRKAGRSMQKGDIVYTAVELGSEWQASVTLVCLGGEEYIGEAAATDKLAEQSAARQALLNHAEEREEQQARKRKALEIAGDAKKRARTFDGKVFDPVALDHSIRNKLKLALMHFLGRDLEQSDIVYETKEVDTGFEATLTLPTVPDLEHLSWMGEVMPTKQGARLHAASKALETVLEMPGAENIDLSESAQQRVGRAAAKAKAKARGDPKDKAKVNAKPKLPAKPPAWSPGVAKAAGRDGFAARARMFFGGVGAAKAIGFTAGGAKGIGGFVGPRGVSGAVIGGKGAGGRGFGIGAAARRAPGGQFIGGGCGGMWGSGGSVGVGVGVPTPSHGSLGRTAVGGCGVGVHRAGGGASTAPTRAGGFGAAAGVASNPRPPMKASSLGGGAAAGWAGSYGPAAGVHARGLKAPMQFNAGKQASVAGGFAGKGRGTTLPPMSSTKGGTKGGVRAPSIDRGPLAPTAPAGKGLTAGKGARTRLSGGPFSGEIVKWAGEVGLIMPYSQINHPKASMREGLVRVTKKDLAKGLNQLWVGAMVKFRAYAEAGGIGAEQVQVAT
mmetsp:Transcript_46267/g.134764  ORF Transcript_46267/g.134764 Transcript_46267/m.134764 type:complete len:579 (+) Transcript_46267:131-1867(+)